MKFRTDCPASIYYGLLALAAGFYLCFVVAFLIGYFDPYYLTEARASAPLQSVMGLLDGINPFDNQHVEEYGNLYSIVWPYLNYLVASAAGISRYYDLKMLIFALNALFVFGAAAAAVLVGLRNKLDTLATL
jgi:hypothetical protein